MWGVLNTENRAEKVAMSFYDRQNLRMLLWTLSLKTIANNMIYIYYFLLAINLFWEVMNYKQPKDMADFPKNVKNADWMKNEDNKRFAIFVSLWQLFYCTLIIIWFFSFQWWLFLWFFLFGVIKSMLPRKEWIQISDGVVSSLFIIFAVLNGIHFHITPF